MSKRNHPAVWGSRQLAAFLSSHPTALGILHRFAGSIDAQTCAVVAAMAGPVGIFIPWPSLDGHASALSGVGLMTYAFQGNDRLVMWRISPLATALVLAVPFGIATVACCTAWIVLRRTYRVDIPLFTFTGILVLLRFTPAILDGQMRILGSFAVPGPGLAILMVATLAVITISSGRLRRRSLPAQP